MFPGLLDPGNERNFVFPDSAYSHESFQDLINLCGFESLIHEKMLQSPAKRRSQSTESC